MKKKITKILESTLPGQLFDRDEEPINRRKLADKIYDALPNVERLDLQPFERWIPKQCSGCPYSEPYKAGCTYLLASESNHEKNPIPEDCPFGYS